MAKSDHLTDHQRMAWDKITHYDKTGEGEFWRNPDDNTMIAVKYGARFAGISTLRALAKAGLIELPNPKLAWFRVLIPPSLYDIGDPYPITPADAAIAQPAAAPTVNADVVSYLHEIKRNDGCRIHLTDAQRHPAHAEAYRLGYVRPTISGHYVITGKGHQVMGNSPIADELEPASADAVNAADVGEVADEMERFFTMSDAQKFSELINQADVIRKNDAQIAALTRDLADAVAERDALRKAANGVLIIAALGLRYMDEKTARASAHLLNVFVDEHGLDRPANMLNSADAAMVAALRSRDNGKRTPADNVLAMFADGEDAVIGEREEWTPKVGDKVYVSRDANLVYESATIQQAQRDKYPFEVVSIRDKGELRFLLKYAGDTVRCALDELEPVEEAQS